MPEMFSVGWACPLLLYLAISMQSSWQSLSGRVTCRGVHAIRSKIFGPHHQSWQSTANLSSFLSELKTR